MVREIKFRGKSLKHFWGQAQYAACSVHRCKTSNATKYPIEQSFVCRTVKDASYMLCLTEPYHNTEAQNSKSIVHSCVSDCYNVAIAVSSYTFAFPTPVDSQLFFLPADRLLLTLTLLHWQRTLHLMASVEVEFRPDMLRVQWPAFASVRGVTVQIACVVVNTLRQCF